MPRQKSEATAAAVGSGVLADAEERQRRGDELANALVAHTAALRTEPSEASVAALGDVLQQYSRAAHGDATPLLAALISATLELAAAHSAVRRRRDAIKMIDTAIALQRVIDRRRLGAAQWASASTSSGASSGQTNPSVAGAAAASRPSAGAPTLGELDTHQLANVNMLVMRAGLLFDSGHFLMAAKDLTTIERALSSGARRVQKTLRAVGRACAPESDELHERVRVEQLEKGVSALRQEFNQLDTLYNETHNLLIENIATCYRMFGCFGEARDWLDRTPKPTPRILAQRALCDLVRAPRKPEEVSAAIALVQSCATPETLAPALGLIQAIVQQYISTHAVERMKRGRLSEDAAVRKECDAVLPALSNGQISGLASVAEGLPEAVLLAEKHIVHSVITVINFATSYSSMDVWNAVIAEASGGGTFGSPPPTIEAVTVSRIPELLANKFAAQLHAVDGAEAVMLRVEFDRIVADLLALGAELGPGSPTLLPPGTGHRVDPKEIAPPVSPYFIQQQFAASTSMLPVAGTEAAGGGDAGHVLDEPFSPLVRHHGASQILNAPQRRALHDRLPLHHQRVHWRCVYSTAQHGTSLKTLYANAFDEGPPVLLVMAVEGAIIGAFLTTQLRVSSRYTGTGESFVFTFRNKDSADMEYHRWAEGSNQYICMARRDSIAIGGGGRGAAIRLRESLIAACSSQCATFASPPLTSVTDDDDFAVFGVEVLALDPVVADEQSHAAEVPTQPHGAAMFFSQFDLGAQ